MVDIVKKILHFSYKKTRLIPGKVRPVHVQQEFAEVLYQLYDIALSNDKEVLLFACPVHQIHNNEWVLNTKQIRVSGYFLDERIPNYSEFKKMF